MRARVVPRCGGGLAQLRGGLAELARRMGGLVTALLSPDAGETGFLLRPAANATCLDVGLNLFQAGGEEHNSLKATRHDPWIG